MSAILKLLLCGRMVVVLILVGIFWCWWLSLIIIGDGGLMMVVLIKAAVRVAAEISTNLFDYLFWGGIHGVGSV